MWIGIKANKLSDPNDVFWRRKMPTHVYLLHLCLFPHMYTLPFSFWAFLGYSFSQVTSLMWSSSWSYVLVVTLPPTLNITYESRGRTWSDGCRVEFQFTIIAVWLCVSHLKWLSLSFLTATIGGTVMVTRDHEGTTGLLLRGYSWMVSELGKQSLQSCKGPLPPTTFILSQTLGSYLEKRAKFIEISSYNWKIQILETYIRIRCQKVESVHCHRTPKQAPWAHHPGTIGSKSFPCLSLVHKRTPASFFLFTSKFSTNILSIQMTMWSPSWSLNPILCSQHQWMVGLAFKRGPHMFSGTGGARFAAARHLWLHSEVGPLPLLFTLT